MDILESELITLKSSKGDVEIEVFELSFEGQLRLHEATETGDRQHAIAICAYWAMGYEFRQQNTFDQFCQQLAVRHMDKIMKKSLQLAGLDQPEEVIEKNLEGTPIDN